MDLYFVTPAHHSHQWPAGTPSTPGNQRTECLRILQHPTPNQAFSKLILWPICSVCTGLTMDFSVDKCHTLYQATLHLCLTPCLNTPTCSLCQLLRSWTSCGYLVSQASSTSTYPLTKFLSPNIKILDKSIPTYLQFNHPLPNLMDQQTLLTLHGINTLASFPCPCLLPGSDSLFIINTTKTHLTGPLLQCLLQSKLQSATRWIFLMLLFDHKYLL